MTNLARILGLASVAAVLCACPSNNDSGKKDIGVPPVKKPDVHVTEPDLPDGELPPEPLNLAFEEVELSAETLGVTEIQFVPGTEDEFLLLEKDGRVLHFALDGDATRLLGEFQVPDVFPGSDCGLISAAFDPEFATNGFVYFGYCVDQTVNRITRHEFDDTDYGKIASKMTKVIEVGDPDAPKSWHNVGSMGFGPDGVLWALFGEKVLEDEAQNLANNLGTLIRIIPNRDPAGSGYTPAPDNPFVEDPNRSADVYAYGLRSPWKGTLDDRGRFWVGDVGAATYEELNVVTEPGQNFGWPEWEGRCEANCAGLVQPLSYWDRSSESDYALEDAETNATDRRVVWVGPQYDDTTEDRYDGKLTGKVLFGDFCAGWVRAAELDDEDRLVHDEMKGHLDSVTGAAQAPDGYLYFVTYGNCKTFPYREGRLWRAVPR